MFIAHSDPKEIQLRRTEIYSVPSELHQKRNAAANYKQFVPNGTMTGDRVDYAATWANGVVFRLIASSGCPIEA
jgi:hypothetical protein